MKTCQCLVLETQEITKPKCVISQCETHEQKVVTNESGSSGEQNQIGNKGKGTTEGGAQTPRAGEPPSENWHVRVNKQGTSHAHGKETNRRFMRQVLVSTWKPDKKQELGQPFMVVVDNKTRD